MRQWYRAIIANLDQWHQSAVTSYSFMRYTRKMNVTQFQQLIWQKGKQLYRPMPWRERPTFYYVLVSEIMLQQTQVGRVLAKFTEFTRTFPTIDSLAATDLPRVLAVWQGLGYNRRAKYLHQAAQAVAASGASHTQAELMKLPGVGANTAAAILNYVYEIPTSFVETNIRTVYFHHFFANETRVSDRDVLVKVTETIDTARPREWFWALMDYGAELKRQGYGRLSQSKHYVKQPPLDGSMRQMRGEIIRRYTHGQSVVQIARELSSDPRFAAALRSIQNDGLISE